ncbi:hypothetical protein CDD83_6032 [Cordyceps sp. RAO-2017]|nr:hypothetical protein CDD83_6032 [Cordyceps sp. RAO-2017]
MAREGAAAGDEFDAAVRGRRRRDGLLSRLLRPRLPASSCSASASSASAAGPPPVYQVGFHRQVWALMKRQFALRRQDRFQLTLSWARSLAVALVLGTLYLRLGRTSGSAFGRGGLLFIALLFNAFQAFSELAGTLLGRAVLGKHRAYAFHRPSALWIAQIVVDQAFAASEILLFSVVVYFMTGLARGPGAFFAFYLLILSGNVAMTLVFRIVGCLSPDFDYALRFAVVVITLFVSTSGYLIQYQSERLWLRWIYWLNVLGLVFGALMDNEFSRLDLTCTADSLVPAGPGYDDIRHQVCTLPGARPGTARVRGADYIASAFSYPPGGLWRNWAIVAAIILFFLGLNVVLGELVSFGAVGGDAVRVYQRPSRERDALNARLMERREARRRRLRAREEREGVGGEGGEERGGEEFLVRSESVLT